jgi:hypothetical protein
MVPQMIWAGLVPVCVLAAWLVVRRPVRWIVEDRDFARARDLFRLQREGLEAKFLGSLARLDPIERLRWEDAHWHDDVVWARDRQSRRLLALVGVHFDVDPLSGFPDEPPHQATALFEFRKGRWSADGRHIDEIRPDEAFLRHREFEPVVLPPRQRA